MQELERSDKEQSGDQHREHKSMSPIFLLLRHFLSNFFSPPGSLTPRQIHCTGTRAGPSRAPAAFGAFPPPSHSSEALLHGPDLCQRALAASMFPK